MADDMWATPVVNGNGIPPAATNGGGMTQDLIGSSSECAASPPSSDSAIHSESQGGGILIDLDNATQPSITPQSPPSFDPLGDLQQFNSSAAAPKDPVPASTNPFADPISDPFSVQPAANPPQSNQAPPADPFDPIGSSSAHSTPSPAFFAPPPPPVSELENSFTESERVTTEDMLLNTNPFHSSDDAPQQPLEVFGAPPPQSNDTAAPLPSQPDLTGAPGAPVAVATEDLIAPAITSQVHAAPPGGVSAPIIAPSSAAPVAPEKIFSPEPAFIQEDDLPPNSFQREQTPEPSAPSPAPSASPAPAPASEPSTAELISPEESITSPAPSPATEPALTPDPAPPAALPSDPTPAVTSDIAPSPPAKEGTFTKESPTNEPTPNTATKAETKTAKKDTPTTSKTETKKESSTGAKRTIKAPAKKTPTPKTPTDKVSPRSGAKTPTTPRGTGSGSRPKSVPPPTSRIPTSPKKTATPRSSRSKGGFIYLAFLLLVFACRFSFTAQY